MNDPFKKIHLRVNPDFNHLEIFVWVVHVHVDKNSRKKVESKCTCVFVMKPQVK